MKRPKPIKPFKTLDEEAHFWDTHDFSAVFDRPNTPLSRLPRIKEDKGEVMTIRVEKSLKKAIEKVARTKGINPTTMSRMWIVEGLKKEYLHGYKH